MSDPVSKAATKVAKDVNTGLTDAGRGLNSLGADAGRSLTRGISDLAKNTVGVMGKNLERSSSRLLNSYAFLLSGKKGSWDNFGNTLLESAMYAYDLGAFGYKAGENNVDRAQTTAQEDAVTAQQAQEAADAQAKKDKEQSDVNTIVNEMVASRRRQPGRAALLLTSGGLSSGSGALLNTRVK
jgi:hypothetical protein